MPDSIESRQEFKKAGQAKRAAAFLPRPRTMGSFFFLITILSFVAGWLRNELALTLLGTVFLIILVYCFLGVLLTGIIYHKKGSSLSIAISPETVSAGKKAELCIKTNGGFPPENKHFLRPPAILIRCELSLETGDGRVMRHFADPGKENLCSFTVNERGAYYSGFRFSGHPCEHGDRFVVFDAPGFFRISLPLAQAEDIRLLAVPFPAGELSCHSLKPGGSEERSEVHYRKNDDFTDHRPYIPGDDPRRINWKLYGHAPLGELFVREGVPEPPPHSRLLILVDTEVDRSLYALEEGRLAVDVLCETALAAALEYQSMGIDVHMGCTGGKIMGGKDESLNAADLASAMARPFAIFSPEPKGSAELLKAELLKANLPPAPKDTATLILALPRTFLESALEKFIKLREAKQEVEIVFLYNNEEQEEAAGTCINLYNGKAAVRALKAASAPWRNRGEGN